MLYSIQNLRCTILSLYKHEQGDQSFRFISKEDPATQAGVLIFFRFEEIKKN